VPVDVVAGSSMGAVIGAGYAAGATGSDLEVYAERAASLLRLVRAFDVAFTGDGILAGRQLLDYFRPFLHGARRFDELVLPARIVATDLSHGRTVAIGEGDLEAALRASIAMPPFLTPVLRDGQTLVDGGIVDPLPVDVVRDLGADIVIAVHAIPALDADAATLLTRVSRTLNRVNPVAWLAGRSRSLNLIDLVMNSFHLVEHQLGAHLARGAEVVVEPDLSGHTWIEFYRAHELIERGASAARRAIPDIETVLAQRLAATRPGTGAATPA
jgi:NTE family protein